MEALPDGVPAVLNALRIYFGDRLQTGSSFGVWLEGAAGDLLSDGVRLSAGWDIWSGRFLMAWDEPGNQLVREIAEKILNNQEEPS